MKMKQIILISLSLFWIACAQNKVSESNQQKDVTPNTPKIKQVKSILTSVEFFDDGESKRPAEVLYEKHFDEENRLIKERSYGTISSYSYNENGKVKEKKIGKGNRRITYTYEGNKEIERLLEGDKEMYQKVKTFNEQGQLLSELKDGIETTYFYENDRLVTKGEYQGKKQISKIDYQYDENGNPLMERLEKNNKEIYTINRTFKGNLLLEEKEVGEDIKRTTRIKYNKEGKILSKLLLSEGKVSNEYKYSYNEHGLLTEESYFADKQLESINRLSYFYYE